MHASFFALVQEGAAPVGGGPRFAVILLQLALFVAIFYFIIIRPNRMAQKRHQEMQREVGKGDEVITEGGIVATVVHVDENRLTVKTAENTRLVVVRSKIARRVEAGAADDGEE